jgi:glycosyltransferase involved in cell wall biosynthesis
MWNNGNNEATVIEHGVTDPGSLYTGELSKGIVVINHLQQRGRKLGADIFNKVKKEIPLDLVGMGSGSSIPRLRAGSKGNPTLRAGSSSGEGLGEVLHPQLPGFISRYRFFFNPIRYTSLGLAVCEAMMTGIPMVALATTENVTVINNGISGFIHTDVDYLIEKMKAMLADPQLAMSIGKEGRKIAEKRFNINRFCKEWENLFHTVINNKSYLYEKQNSVY